MPRLNEPQVPLWLEEMRARQAIIRATCARQSREAAQMRSRARQARRRMALQGRPWPV